MVDLNNKTRSLIKFFFLFKMELLSYILNILSLLQILKYLKHFC